MIKVAIVDDHKVLTDGLKTLIEESGIAKVVCLWHTASDCRASIGSCKPDLLLLDVGLPDMSGVDFCKELKQRYPDLKIMALTTHNEYSVVRHMLENGASGYLVKNAMTEEVLAGIDAVANGNIFLCHEVDVLMKQPKERQLWLSQRESEILKLVAEGLTNGEIADRIFLSPETIKSYRKNLLLKLDAKNTAMLVRIALEQKLI